MKWENYDEEHRIYHVSHSMWRRHIDVPKTEASVADVPVAEVLARILAELPRDSEFILAGPKGRPVDLHNLSARVIRPALRRCLICGEQEDGHEAEHAFELNESLPKWKGWYAFRRAAATAVTSVDSLLAAKSLLRHASVQTTAKHYVKSVPADAVRAVDKINALFDNRSGSGAPN